MVRKAVAAVGGFIDNDNNNILFRRVRKCTAVKQINFRLENLRVIVSPANLIYKFSLWSTIICLE